jgi:hypothetical protein
VPFGTPQVLVSGSVDEAIQSRETALGEAAIRALYAFENIEEFEANHPFIIWEFAVNQIML